MALLSAGCHCADAASFAKKLGSTYMRTEEVELIAALDDLAAPALETRRRRRPSICFKERNGSP